MSTRKGAGAALNFLPDDRIVVWGAGGHASVTADIARLRGATVAGFIDDLDPSRRGQLFCGARIFGADDLALLRGEASRYGIVAVGDGPARHMLTERMTAADFVMAVLVHPAAVVAGDAAIGCGTLIAAGAVVAVGARIGRGCILNTCASVDHDSRVGDWVHICPGAHVAGAVSIGESVWVGAGATVSDHVSIGARSVIGAGSVVVSTIPEGVIAYGVPARVVRPV
jgi:sugar O-acyltransferase (sialic acid O-acetyltransferase NeuD family)